MKPELRPEHFTLTWIKRCSTVSYERPLAPKKVVKKVMGWAMADRQPSNFEEFRELMTYRIARDPYCSTRIRGHDATIEIVSQIAKEAYCFKRNQFREGYTEREFRLGDFGALVSGYAGKFFPNIQVKSSVPFWCMGITPPATKRTVIPIKSKICIWSRTETSKVLVQLDERQLRHLNEGYSLMANRYARTQDLYYELLSAADLIEVPKIKIRKRPVTKAVARDYKKQVVLDTRYIKLVKYPSQELSIMFKYGSGHDTEIPTSQYKVQIPESVIVVKKPNIMYWLVIKEGKVYVPAMPNIFSPSLNVCLNSNGDPIPEDPMSWIESKPFCMEATLWLDNWIVMKKKLHMQRKEVVEEYLSRGEIDIVATKHRAKDFLASLGITEEAMKGAI